MYCSFFFLYIYTCICAHFSFVTGTRCKGDYFQEKEKKELQKNQRASTGVLDSNYLITYCFHVILFLLILLDEWLSSSGVDKVKDNWYWGNWETSSCIDWKAFKTCQERAGKGSSFCLKRMYYPRLAVDTYCCSLCQ